MRRYPRVDGPAVLPLFCLAPHGVFRASRITPRAVSSYLAFSPLPALFSKNRRCLFCDTFRHRNFATAAPACFTRHAAVWCSDFPLASLTTYQRSSATEENYHIQEGRKIGVSVRRKSTRSIMQRSPIFAAANSVPRKSSDTNRMFRPSKHSEHRSRRNPQSGSRQPAPIDL